ncbi:hypothetical protein DSO57_1012210 [Entomophthora muscae]|uniref:Uncharacterized protein n=1 Tax=Entomophthora muscae TaxID=34485 RepID=A0ACC2URE7_9FUNG|nr:hypothetical protein DSO57_1012210 [Entomophthora muscae]
MKVKTLPLSVGEVKGISLYASCNVTIPPGSQMIHNTCLLLALPAGTHGEIFGIPNASRLEPWVAPGILMSSEKEVLILLANMSCQAMVVSKHQLLAYIWPEEHDNLQETTPFVDFSELSLPCEQPLVLLVISRCSLSSLSKEQKDQCCVLRRSTDTQRGILTLGLDLY